MTKIQIPRKLGITTAAIAITLIAATMTSSNLAFAHVDVCAGSNNGKPFQELWGAICDLQHQIDTIQLTPGPPGPPGPSGPPGPPVTVSEVMWTNYLTFLPGDPTVSTSFNAINSGVGTGLSGLIVQSSTTGDTSGGGNKVVETGLQVPPLFSVTGVKVCYATTSTSTYIEQIRISQLQSPPNTALVLLDSVQPQPTSTSLCVDSSSTLIDPTKGQLSLSLRLNVGNTADKIVIRGVGLDLTGTVP